MTHAKILACAGSSPSAGNDECKCWYSIQAKSQDEKERPEEIEVMIYDEIGLWGIDAGRFIADFKTVDDGKAPVTVAINSPGGDVFDGFALNGWMNRLGERCTARIDGLAASAASVIACGAHKVVMGQSALMMIHNPWTVAVGNSDDLRKTADDMDKARDGILAAYRRKAPDIEDAEFVRMLDEETWLNAEEAVALGLADVIAESAAVKACRGSSGILARYRHLPKALQEEPAKPEQKPQGAEQKPPAAEQRPPETEQQAASTEADIIQAAASITQACIDAGCPQIAGTLLMTTKLSDKAAVKAEADRIKAIGDLCVVARMPELAASYAQAGLTVDAVRNRLLSQLTQAGGVEIDNKEPPADKPNNARVQKPLNAKAIYDARNGKTQKENDQ